MKHFPKRLPVTARLWKLTKAPGVVSHQSFTQDHCAALDTTLLRSQRRLRLRLVSEIRNDPSCSGILYIGKTSHTLRIHKYTWEAAASSSCPISKTDWLVTHLLLIYDHHELFKMYFYIFQMGPFIPIPFPLKQNVPIYILSSIRW